MAQQMAIFDLDGTLTRRDTFAPFLAGYLLRHPARLWRLWRLPWVLAEFLLSGRDRGRLKAQVIQIVMGGEQRARIDAWADAFARSRAAGKAFRPDALAMLETHRRAGDRLDGALITPNRRGEEKSRCLQRLRERHPALPIVAYGNSASDLAHMAQAERALLVNAAAAAKRLAAKLRIPVADWQ